jgi:ADP-ribose pyrophosphatase YjhB (NUDIX family)
MPSLPYRLLLRAKLAVWRSMHGMSLGVRAMLIRDDAVLLVKHSYVPGWHFPGGGVDAGESAIDALGREVREETGARLTAPPALFGVYRNPHADLRDHVLLYVCRDWEQEAPFRANAEIIACRAFPIAALPATASPGTAARLREVLHGAAPATDW